MHIYFQFYNTHWRDKNDCTTNKYIHTYNIWYMCISILSDTFFLDRVKYEILGSRVTDFFHLWSCWKHFRLLSALKWTLCIGVPKIQCVENTILLCLACVVQPYLKRIMLDTTLKLSHIYNYASKIWILWITLMTVSHSYINTHGIMYGSSNISCSEAILFSFITYVKLNIAESCYDIKMQD